MEIRSAKFEVSAVRANPNGLGDFGQIAFVGRSNVGKSSLINMLTKQGKLCKTSSTPGRTRLINYFLINDNLYFVDLPGYGYSTMSQLEKKSTSELINKYITNNNLIAHIFFLVDIRHKPTNDDILMLECLNSKNIPYTIIANKADKIAITKVDEQVSNLQNVLNPLKDLTFLPFASERKVYVDNAWKNIEYYIK